MSKMLFLLISVSLVNLIVSPVDGLIKIESQPAKVRNGKFAKLTCDVGTMENTVKWVYGGVTYFSCNPPYTNCFTNTSVTNDGFYDFKASNDSLIAIFPVNQNQNDGIWSCYHGNDKADIDIDNGDVPRITYYSASSKTQEYKIRYSVQSQAPVDVLIYAEGYHGTRILYDVKQSSLSDNTVNTTLLCSEIRIFWNVTNGYGPTVTKYRYIDVRCPLKILRDMSALTFDVNDIYNQFKIYYEGYPDPSSSLFRIGTDGVPEVTGLIPDYSPLETRKLAYIYVNSYYNPDIKTGKYILTLKQGNITEVVHLNFIRKPISGISRMYTMTTAGVFFGTSRIYPRKTTTAVPFRTSRIDPRKTTTAVPFRTSRIDPRKTTTAVPFRTSRIDPRKTTNRAENNDMKTLEDSRLRSTTKETTIMNYLGVAGFVISLILVLILVIVGVFWFIGIKRKPTGTFYPSTDSRYPGLFKPNLYEDMIKN